MDVIRLNIPQDPLVGHKTQRLVGSTRGPAVLSPGFLPSLYIPQARRDVVLAPGGALGISSFVSYVLFCLDSGIVEPGVASCLIVL